ncbi:ATP-binding protein [Streptomyces sp. NPDC048664]|uniref:ATP-binding protein n=1 Tax=Streptomyces sp. NPDC048664 TaxID=3154505 RepID=UPI0034195371
MAIPLRNPGAGRRTQLLGSLRYSADWGTGAVRASDARGAVTAVLAQAGHTPDRRPTQNAQLVVSELVTNALVHAPGPSGLRLELTPESLLITVWDSSPRPPRSRAPDPGRIGGHGLHLVTALSEDLRTTATPSGKRVTATVRLSG